MSTIFKKPVFIQDPLCSCEWELMGPLFSISCVKNNQNKYDIVLDYSDGSFSLKEDSTEDEAVAKNLCTVYYNRTLEGICQFKAEMEE